MAEERENSAFENVKSEMAGDPTIKIKDSRKRDSATGAEIREGNRMSADVNVDLVKQIVSKARKAGVDPATALAIGLNETGLHLDKPNKYFPDPLKASNTFMVGKNDEINIDGKKIGIGEWQQKTSGSNIDAFFEIFKDKLKDANRLGKKDEAEIIQSFNGYGKIDKGTLYGIDTEKHPIDFNKNPVYGKRVIDIRENIIKKNPEIQKIINSK